MQAVGAFDQPLLQARKRRLAVWTAKRRDRIGQIARAAAEPVQCFEQALGPLCVLEPRFLSGGRPEHGRDLRIEGR